MEQQTTLDTATGSQESIESQEGQSTRAFIQDELDKIVADRIARERGKYEKKYAGIDLDRYQTLMDAEEKRIQDEQKARGEFENILKNTVEKKDSVISQLKSELQAVKVDGQLLNIASTNRVVNPQQVVRLLKDQVRLAETGDVEVIDPRTGQLKYSESGDPYGINDLVSEFLRENPHFVAAAPAGSGSRSNVNPGKSNQEVDPSKLDMTNPEHRAVYKEYRKHKGLQ
jgi:hypothetical protein